MNNRSFTNEELTAYLDGELPDAAAADLTARLATDADLAARLAALDIPLEALRDGSDALLASAPQPLAITAPPARRSRLVPAAALIAGIAIGVTANGFWQATATPGWVEAIVSYQTLYTERTIAHIETPAPGTADLMARFAESEGWSQPDLARLDGVNLRRAQLLGYQDRDLLQVVYATETGVPVALCIVAVGDQDRAATIRQYGALNGASWVSDGFGYVLIGNIETDQLSDLLGQLNQPA